MTAIYTLTFTCQPNIQIKTKPVECDATYNPLISKQTESSSN